ncbi:MAG: radical SAM protein [Acidobacteria bacterium]|nr:MAG: radical SAM protein [Acidobacteriota bacterium]
MEQATLFQEMSLKPEPLREKNDVQYFHLAAKTILNSCNTCRMPNAVTLNPYRGCEFGCAYCYARYTHEFMELPWGDFERRIFVKTAAPGILLRTLDVEKLRGKHVAIGSATDPYQPAESRFHLTRRLLEVFAQVRGLSISLTTKSALVKRDIDLFLKIGERNDFRVNVSLISLNAALLRALEPKSSTPEARLGALKSITEAGVPAGVLLMPIIPALTDSERTLESVIRAAAAHGAQYVHGRVLFLKDSAKRSFYEFLKRTTPHLHSRYSRIYGKRIYTSDEYQREILSKVKRLKEKYNLNQRDKEFEPYEVVDHTGNLFENQCDRTRPTAAGEKM